MTPIRNPLRSPLSSPLSRRRGGGAGPQLVPIPAGFDWTPPVQVYQDGSVYSTDYDPTPFLTEGAPGVTTFYVDSDTGNESNPGTAASPKRSLVGISGGRVAKLLIKARGKFYIGDTGQVQTAHDELVVEAWGGASCIICTERNPSTPLSWADEGGGVWSMVPPFASFNGISVYQGTDVDTLVPYIAATSLAQCQATPGSYFRQTSPSILHFVHTLDGSSPASGHTVYATNGPAQSFNVASRAYDQRIGFYGVQFAGGDSACHIFGDRLDYSKRVDFVNCSFKHGATLPALRCTGTTFILSYGCEAGPSRFDGFSYHSTTNAAGGQVPNAVEINCVGRNNGFIAGANQGSTTHFGGKVLRVNCQYYSNTDQQIADVGINSQSWNVGCVFGPKGVGVNKGAVTAGNDANLTDVWLDGCSFPAPVDFAVDTAAGGVVRYKNMPEPSPASGTGVVEPY
jgi:hypothetical protein